MASYEAFGELRCCCLSHLEHGLLLHFLLHFFVGFDEACCVDVAAGCNGCDEVAPLEPLLGFGDVFDQRQEGCELVKVVTSAKGFDACGDGGFYHVVGKLRDLTCRLELRQQSAY